MKNNLKAKSIIVCILFCICTKSFCQDFKAGVLAGSVFSQVDGDSYAGFNKLGLVSGIYVYRSISKKVDLQLEMKLKQKGSRFTGDKKKGDFRIYRMNLSYLEIPLLMKYHYTDFAVEAGLNFSVLMHSKEKDESGEVIYSNPFEKTELSPLIGFNYEWKNNFSFSVRWSYSLTRIRKLYEGKYDDIGYSHWDLQKPGQYNHAISLVVFYAFRR